MAKTFVTGHNGSVARQRFFVTNSVEFVLWHLFLCIQVKVNVFSVLQVSLTAHNICHCAISQIIK